MEKKGLETALAILTLTAWAHSASLPVPHRSHPGVLLSIPTADVLGHAQYRLSGRFQYFTGSEIGVDSTFDGPADPAGRVRNLNYGSELVFGIENRAEIGVQYGDDLSVSVKALLLREDLLWPDLVFGARNLFGSPEGGLYGVRDSRTLKELQSETYMTLAKSLGGSRAHLGVSVLAHSDRGSANLNAGLEQDLGAGAFLGYEVFERFSDFHQVLSLQWRYRELVAFGVAMTELQSWIRRDGEWGFFFTPSGARRDGYNSPGISVSLQVLGWVPRRAKRTLPERVAILEVRNAKLEKDLQELREVKLRLDEMEARTGAATKPVSAPDPVTEPSSTAPITASPTVAARAMAYLKSIAEKSRSDLADPRGIREDIAKLAGLGPAAADTLIRVAADTGAGVLRVPAVLAMAYSRDTLYVSALRNLCKDPNPRIRREALTALGQLGSRSALEDAKRLLSDPDETVALAAAETYRRLQGAAAASGPKSGDASGSNPRVKTGSGPVPDPLPKPAPRAPGIAR